MVQCVALNCSNRPETKKGLSFFRFPRDKKLRQIWIRKLRRQNYNPIPSACLCSDHFEEEHLKYKPSLMRSIGYTPGKQVLLPGAVPTIFTYERKADGGEDVATELRSKNRGAYLKRERARVLQDIFSTQTEEGQAEQGAVHTTVLKTESVVTPADSLETNTVVVPTGSSVKMESDFEVAAGNKESKDPPVHRQPGRRGSSLIGHLFWEDSQLLPPGTPSYGRLRTAPVQNKRRDHIICK